MLLIWKQMGSFFVYQHYSVTTILQVVTPISFLKNFILGSSLQYRSSKIIPFFFVDKVSCTRQFESEFSLHSLASLFPIKEGIFRKPTRPSLPLRKAPPLAKGSSTFLTKPLFPQEREDVAGYAIASARVLVSSAEPVPTRGCR